MENGYVFIKLNERAKVFIEYAPSEIAYLPINAPNYMVINCFWVSGKYKGHGYGKRLLEKCIEDSKEKGKDGIVILCSDKKRPYMADKKFFLKHGFKKADIAKPYFELLYLKLSNKDILPQFLETTKNGIGENNDGFKVYYSNQ
ncbi:GNAT family N-acetyltransferase [Tepidibacter sp. Z1-5]|uniref:GNAT family N-acetyltransferase n=1 Tax=Tepidibacter sp. Z1-5 TaxID=3134138 RepID=UPI0030C07F7A